MTNTYLHALPNAFEICDSTKDSHTPLSASTDTSRFVIALPFPVEEPGFYVESAILVSGLVGSGLESQTSSASDP